MVVLTLHLYLRSTNQLQETSGTLNRVNPKPTRLSSLSTRRRRLLLCPAAALIAAGADKKPAVCTADELHYMDVQNSDWALALWRYLPSPQAPQRNHPLLLLSGIGSNAIGYDLSQETSFARYMAGQGYDTWTVELRGAGLSTPKMDSGEANKHSNVCDHVNGGSRECPIRSQAQEMALRSGQSDTFNFFDNFAHHWQLEKGKNYSVAAQRRDFIDKLLNGIERVEGLSKPLFSGMQDLISPGLRDIQKQLVNYSWDFENYLEEDVPAAMEYIKTRSKPKDGKLLAIGHSMGGILLYATLSRCCFDGKDSGLASIVTLGASLDFTSSGSSLKMLLPLVDLLQAIDVSMIPIGVLPFAVHPFAARLLYASTWLNTQISAPNMMQPKLFEKLLFGNFRTILPSNLVLQLATAFRERGLCNRSGTLFYKDHLGKSKVPILALAGDQDLICPPEAVYETVKLIPENLITYKVFGQLGGPHYGHYDIVGSHLAKDQVYPCIIEFLNHYDVA